MVNLDKSISSKLEQNANILSIYSTLEVSKESEHIFIFSKEEQELNKLLIFFTLVVLNMVKSTSFNLPHPKNIFSISSTLEVLTFLNSTYSKEEHL